MHTAQIHIYLFNSYIFFSFDCRLHKSTLDNLTEMYFVDYFEWIVISI